MIVASSKVTENIQVFCDALCLWLNLSLSVFSEMLRCINNCGRQEEPAILSSRLYVASSPLDFHLKKEWNIPNVMWSRTWLFTLLIWSRVFWPSVTWNLHKARCWSKSVRTSGHCRPHSLSFGCYYFYDVVNMWLLCRLELTFFWHNLSYNLIFLVLKLLFLNHKIRKVKRFVPKQGKPQPRIRTQRLVY